MAFQYLDHDWERQLYQVERLASRNQSRHEYTRPYLGGDTLPKQLEDYVTSCATQWANTPRRLQCPSISIVQSSGFGKSRLLREIANRTKDDRHGTMKVLYMNVRPEALEYRYASTYPEATFHLRQYFFPVVDEASWRAEPDRDHHGELETKLLRLFSYATTHWRSIGNEWSSLLDGQADAAIYSRLATHKVETTTARKTTAETPRILVLAIDDARSLLPMNEYDTMGWTGRLYSVLATVGAQLRAQYGPHASLFAVLVDSDPRIIPRYADPEAIRRRLSSQSFWLNYKELFPPFVVTHTMDIRFHEWIQDAKQRGLSSLLFYQQLVNYGYDDAWTTLVAMGRPGWHRVQRNDWSEKEEPHMVIQRAAAFLLGGLSVSEVSSFKEQSLFGVASVLCRLGLHAHSWSALASRTVADFMGTLLHVSGSHDQLWTTYASEPVLTFGAARVWYECATITDPHLRLSVHILPEFRRLFRQELVDTNGTSPANLVGRIVLLLAMDAVGVAMVSDPIDARYDRCYAGAFHSVETFLSVLHGDEAVIVRDGEVYDVTSTCGSNVLEMLQQWRDWKVGFSHFVQVTNEPSEHDLWALLARRAAGIFPSEYDTIDLFIPIFKATDVSMVLVQTTSRPRVAAGNVPHTRMHPSSIFTNSFQHWSPHNVVRVSMDLTGTTRKAWYILDPGFTTSEATTTEAFVLCLEGLDGWCARPASKQQGTGADQSIPVVSTGVAFELRELLAPWWALKSIVDESLGHRGRTFLRHDVERAMAMRPLVESLVESESSDDEGKA